MPREKQNSQNKMILAHLEKYGSITPLEAYDYYQCLRLSARIKDLREMGVPIDTEKPVNTKKQYAVYVLKGGKRDGNMQQMRSTNRVAQNPAREMDACR